MKTVIILFGEMGCGKTHWGKILAKECGMEFFDGDDVVTPAMIERVSRFRPLTKAMVDDYVQNHLGPAILERCKIGLFVAQALYRSENRVYLDKYLRDNGIDQVMWYPVRVSFWQNLKQLWSRPNGFRWILYWLMNKPFFQNVPLQKGLCQLKR
jgi:Shikimate kinase